MKYLISTLVIVILFFTITSISHHPEKKISSIQKVKESPDEPYEEFMLQRTYPNKVFDVKAYQSALNSAVSLNRNKRLSRQESWTLEGPGNIGGRFNCIAVNPLNTDVMYAGSANGGVWKTSDNGNSWAPMFDLIPYQAIGAIAINPNNVNEIWVGTGDLNISGTMYLGNGVYKSVDAGITWTYLGLADSYVVSAIIFNPANTNEVLVGTMGNSFSRNDKRGIYKTINGGLSFVQTNFVNDSTGIIDMVQHPVNPSIVYATSFSRLRTPRASLIKGTEVYVYKSTDFGQTWNILSGGLPNGDVHERLGIAISASSPDILYALYSTSDYTNPQLYKTTDGGTIWTQVTIDTFEPYYYGRFGWYFGKIYIDPNDPNTLYIPGVELQYCTDGGSVWNLRAQDPVHADGHFMYFKSSNQFIFCTDGGLYRTTDGGGTWEDIENIPNNQFYAVTENKNNTGVYAGGVQDNGTMYGNAAGINNFTKFYGGDGFTISYTNNPSLLYTETQYGNIVFNDNFPSGNFNGIDQDTNQNYNWHTPYFLSHFGEDTLYFAGQRVMRISNAPYGSFTIISPVLNDSTSPQRVSNISTINQSKLISNILYAGTADGNVWNTLNGGNTWNEITPFQGNSYYVTRVMPSPNEASTAYVTRSGYRDNDNTPLIFKTVDNGVNWTNITGDLPLLAVNDIEIYPGNENIIFIANDAGVYFTLNGGVNWERVGDNMPFVAVLDIHLNYNAGKIIAGTFGRSMYSIDITNLITGIASVEKKIDISIYPNPSSDFINIKTDSKIDVVRVYNSLGVLMIQSQLQLIDISAFPAGNYFVKIMQGENKVVKRFLKL